MNKFERSPSVSLKQKQIPICAKSNDFKGFLFAQQLGTELLTAIRGCRGRSLSLNTPPPLLRLPGTILKPFPEDLGADDKLPFALKKNSSAHTLSSPCEDSYSNSLL